MRRCFALLALCAGFGAAAAYSDDKQSALGKSLAHAFERQEKILNDANATEYVAHIAVNLSQHSGANLTPVVKIIESKDARAAAFPGGFLYVSSGLMACVESEAELAGVLAHEIAHLAAQHGTRPLPHDPNAAQPELPLVFRGGWAGVCGRFTAKAVPASMQDTVRGFEREADNLAVGYLRAAGYDPLAMIEFFNKFRYDNPRLAQADSVDELLALRSDVERNLPPDPGYIVTTTAFSTIHTRFVPKTKPPSLSEDQVVTLRRR
ncbi:MAG TPA: M48 family metalloprotease [Bryobacteraceae bacterium]|nr:M48 family metalloprotease [Bryobacteraceae bacterium]